MSLIRGTSLTGFTELVIELGEDPASLLRGSRLQPAAIGHHDSFIDYRAVAGVLEAAAHATGAQDFGRRLAERQGLEILGPIGVAARTAPTVGAALGAIESYMSYYSPALAVGVSAGPGASTSTFEWRLLDRWPPVHRQAAELALGVSVRVFRLLAGDDFLPTSLLLRHAALGRREEYVRYFGCRVEFAAETYGFRFPTSLLARAIKQDSAVHALAHQYLSGLVGHHAPTTHDAVARLVRRTLATGALDLDVVAAQLGMHRRALQRRLAATGTTYADIVDEVRREEAERYLRDTDMPLGQLAGLLAFSEQSAFTRAARRWFGMPPTQVRAAGSHVAGD